MRPSNGSSHRSSCSSIERRTTASAAFHAPSHSVPGRGAARAASSEAIASASPMRSGSARRSGSAGVPGGSITASRSHDAATAWPERVVGARPNWRTTWGRWVSRNAGSPSRLWPADSAAPGRRSCDVGSASSGHPSASAAVAIAGASPPSNPPARTMPRSTPRTALARSATSGGSDPIARVAATFVGPAAVPMSAAAPLGVSGSGNGRSTWTGPGGGSVASRTASVASLAQYAATSGPSLGRAASTDALAWRP